MLDTMNERGQYGKGSERLMRQADGSSTEGMPQYGELGAVLGLGALIGIVIGSNITFHSPVKKRQK
jgi:hypothetical protein